MSCQKLGTVLAYQLKIRFIKQVINTSYSPNFIFFSIVFLPIQITLMILLKGVLVRLTVGLTKNPFRRIILVRLTIGLIKNSFGRIINMILGFK